MPALQHLIRLGCELYDSTPLSVNIRVDDISRLQEIARLLVNNPLRKQKERNLVLIELNKNQLSSKTSDHHRGRK